MWEGTGKYHTLASFTDERGAKTTYTADGAGRIASSTDADGVTVGYVYGTTAGVDAGRLLQVLDNAGNPVTTYAYDSARRLSKTTSAAGWSETIGVGKTSGYDANGNVFLVTDRRGTTTTSTNDALGRALVTVTPNGAGTGTITSKASYDAMGRMVGTVDPYLVTGSTAYNSRGELVRVAAAENTSAARVTTYLNDPNGNAVGVRDGNALWTWFDRDAAGYVWRTTDGASPGVGDATVTVTNLAGETVAATDPRGFVSVVGRDGRGRATTVTDPLSKTWTTTLDAASNVLGQLSPLGQGPTATLTPAGRLATARDGSLAGTLTKYDTDGRPNWESDANGRKTAVTVTTYAADWQVATETAYDYTGKYVLWGATYAYASNGDLTSVTTTTSGTPATTSYAYDTLGRVIGVTDANTHTSTTAYNDVGAVVSVTDATLKTTGYGLDGQYRAVSTTDASGRTTYQIRDPEGRVTLSLDAGLSPTWTGYDADGRVWYTKAADGGTTWRQYDDADNLVRIVDPAGNATRYVYDANGRPEKTIDPANQTVTNTYDDAGRLDLRTDRLGRVIDYDYDAADRVTTETWKIAGVPVDTLAYTYWSDGGVKTASNGTGGYAFVYDAMGRVATQSDTYTGVTLTSGYDLAGDRVLLTDGTVTVTSGYDAAHRMTSQAMAGTNLAGSGVGFVGGVRVAYAYTDRDQRLTAERYNAPTGGTLVGSTAYTYDDAGRAQTITQKNGGGTALAAWTYAYDTAGNVLSETPLVGAARVFGHDATNQVTSDTQGAGSVYTYDRNGNRTMAGYSTGVANRIDSDGVWGYTYDVEGNVVAKGKSGEYWTYTYDHRNQMTSAVKSATLGGAATLTLAYRLDVYGNVVARTENGTATTGTAFEIVDNSPGFTRSVHTRWADLDASGKVTAWYLTSGEETAAVVTPSGVSWLLADRLGSTRLVADKTGAVVSTIDYTAFGGIASESNASLSGNVLFTGGWYDRAVELYQMHWRSYDPANGQWVSEDPIGFSAGDMNTRRYVGNNATNGVDRNGLEVPGFQHFYPLYLGGDDKQKLFQLSGQQHTAAHDVLRKHGVGMTKGISYDQARANWARMTPAQQRAIVIESMKAADLPDAVINQHIDNIFENSRPGINRTAERGARSVLRSVTKATLDTARKAAAFAAKHAATVVVGGVVFFYDKSVSAGEKGGGLLADRIGLGRQLQIDGDEGNLPSREFKIILHDRTVHVELIPDPADSKGGHFITAFYYQQHNDGTWGWLKRTATFGDAGLPYTERVDIIKRGNGYKTYGLMYPRK